VDFTNEERNKQIAYYLSTLRSQKSLTLEQVSELSQVPIVHIIALEEARFDRFESFYLGLYLKRYSDSLGTDLSQIYSHTLSNPVIENTETSDVPSPLPKEFVNQNLTPQKPDFQVNKPVRRTVNVNDMYKKPNRVSRDFSKYGLALFLCALLIIVIIFVISLIRDRSNNEHNLSDGPLVENHHNIVMPQEDLDDEEDDNEPEVEVLPIIVDITEIVFDAQTGDTQVFDIFTNLSEVTIRLEHDGQNWIELTNETVDDTWIYTFEISDDPIRLRVGAVNNISEMFINDVPVDFLDFNGAQTFFFYITEIED